MVLSDAPGIGHSAFLFEKDSFHVQKKAAGHRSAKRSFLLCISLPCGNEGIAGFLGIGKSWNSANRGVRNNHTKPTIKPVCRLGKLAEFLDKSRRNDKKSNEMRWTKSTTRVLLSERPRVRIAVDAPKKKKCCHLRVNRHFFFCAKPGRPRFVELFLFVSVFHIAKLFPQHILNLDKAFHQFRIEHAAFAVQNHFHRFVV